MFPPNTARKTNKLKTIGLDCVFQLKLFRVCFGAYNGGWVNNGCGFTTGTMAWADRLGSRHRATLLRVSGFQPGTRVNNSADVVQRFGFANQAGGHGSIVWGFWFTFPRGTAGLTVVSGLRRESRIGINKAKPGFGFGMIIIGRQQLLQGFWFPTEDTG